MDKGLKGVDKGSEIGGGVVESLRQLMVKQLGVEEGVMAQNQVHILMV